MAEEITVDVLAAFIAILKQRNPTYELVLTPLARFLAMESEANFGERLNLLAKDEQSPELAAITSEASLIMSLLQISLGAQSLQAAETWVHNAAVEEGYSMWPEQRLWAGEPKEENRNN